MGEEKMLDNFHVVNRIRNSVSEVFDMSSIRTVFFKAQDYYQEMEQFILEKYHIPSSYQELQRRMHRERTQIEFKVEDQHDQEVAHERFTNLKLLRDQTNFIWILNKKEAGKSI